MPFVADSYESRICMDRWGNLGTGSFIWGYGEILETESSFVDFIVVAFNALAGSI